MTKPREQIKVNRSLMRKLTKARWKPWPRPQPGEEFVTTELMNNIGTTAALAYGFMFMTREEIGKAVAKEIATGSKAFLHLIADCSTTLDALKALIEIVEGAQVRLITGGAALPEEKAAA